MMIAERTIDYLILSLYDLNDTFSASGISNRGIPAQELGNKMKIARCFLIFFDPDLHIICIFIAQHLQTIYESF
jgi:hypothetical protein